MPENKRFGREPIQVVQIDQDFCNLTYGVVGAPESSLGNEGTTPQALVSNEGEHVAFRENDPVLLFHDSDGVESQYIRAGYVGQRNAYTVSANQIEDFLTAAVASGAFTIEMDYRFVAGESGQDYLFTFSDAANDNNLQLWLTFFSTGGEDFVQVNLNMRVDDIPVTGSSGTYNLGAPGTYESVVHHIAVTAQNDGGNVIARYYFDGNFLGQNDGPNQGDFAVRSVPGAIGVYVDEAFSSRQSDLSNIRLWTSKRSDAEIDANKYRAITTAPADLFANFVYDHASIGERVPGCNAALAANLLTYSENTDLMPLQFYSFLRRGVQDEPDGFAYQDLVIVQSNGLGFFRTENRAFLILEGDDAVLKARFKKTAAPGTVRVEVGTEVDIGGSITLGANSVDVNAQTGAFVASTGFGYFDTEYDITDEGDHVAVQVRASNNSPSVLDSSEFNALFRLDAAEGDSILVGALQLGPAKDVGTYVKTVDVAKEPTGTQKCFNTRSTCQDPANYDKGVLPLNFVDKRSPAPKDDFYIPSLGKVRVTPARLNPGGADRNAGALGQRASITVPFTDHPYNDRLVDKYRTERDYDPVERGTFWTKWRARNPYYMQRPIRLRTGYLKDGVIVDEITREFVITGFSGPDAEGNVSIQGKDVLTLAEDEKAQAPVASQGKLAAGITATATSATLTPAGIGDSKYPASGQIRIGKEVVSFTRSGDSLTLTRGQFGTDAKAHDEDDLVQLCLRYVSEAPQDILEDLLTNYAGIPASYIDKVQWDAEALDFLPRLYSAIITEPQGVSKLISEMAQQMYFTVWFDERIGKIILKAVRLAQEDEVFELDDDKHLIADSVAWKDLSDELITQVWVYYGQIDPTEKIDQGSNYSTIAITADPSAEGADKHNLRRIKTIFSRWIDATNASAAEDLGHRILDRYGNAPRQVTFRVDAKDDYLWLGNFIRLSNRLRVNQFGEVNSVNAQIFQAEESALGSEYKFTAQEFIPALIGDDQVTDPAVRTIPITSDLLNVNLRTLHDALFGAPAGTETITFVVRQGVVIGGDTLGGGENVPFGQRVEVNDSYAAGTALRSGYNVGTLPPLQRRAISSARTIARGADYDGRGAASWIIKEYPVSTGLKTGTWPAGVTLKLVVEAGARVLGEGGTGSAHNLNNSVGGFTDSAIDPVEGGDGGDALDVGHAIEITNGGIIGGGGGGGSGLFADSDYATSGVSLEFISGGGGGGFNFGQATQPTFKNADVNIQTLIRPSGLSTLRDAAAGALTAGGTGGAALYDDGRFLLNSIAGAGSAVTGGGAASTWLDRRIGSDGSVLVVADFTFNRGGLPGKAVRSGANLITWVNKGDVRGDEAI